jgi:hypothetical protein
MNEYTQKKNEATNKLIDELNEASLKYRFTWDKHNNDDQIFIKLSGKYPIEVNYNDYQNTYNFWLHHNLPYIDYETVKRVEETIGKPNNMHKLNGKAIDAWIDFLIKVYEELKTISTERVLKVSEFELLMRRNNASISEKGYKGTFSGSIKKNGLQFSFEVSESGYISQSITTHYSIGRNFETFEQLADNKFKTS